jgi:hypothetical protein
MTDFFISYTHADTAWAEWIGYVLEEEGFTVVIQAWDFRPGSNFVLEMQRAAAEATRTIMVLSSDYLKSQFASPEWAAAFSQDPQSLNRKLVPVQVRDCQPKGLLASIVQIRIADKDEAAARTALLQGINQKRAKPSNRPAFPGEAPVAVEHKAFPGRPATTSTRQVSAVGLIPPLMKAPSDVDKRRFVRRGFETIRVLFESNLQAVPNRKRASRRISSLGQPRTFAQSYFWMERAKVLVASGRAACTRTIISAIPRGEAPPTIAAMNPCPIPGRRAALFGLDGYGRVQTRAGF